MLLIVHFLSNDGQVSATLQVESDTPEPICQLLLEVSRPGDFRRQVSSNMNQPALTYTEILPASYICPFV